MSHHIKMIFALFLLMPQILMATLMKPYSLAELKEKSTHIALIEINRCQSQWQDRRIVSVCEFQVLHQYQAKQGQEQINTLFFFGGEVDGIAQQISGAPQLKVGDQVLAFLDCQKQCKIVGFSQGIWYAEQRVTLENLNQVFFAPRLDGVSFVGKGDVLGGMQRRLILDVLK
jgi:hypothetical protein